MMPFNVLWFVFTAVFVVPPPIAPLEISKETTFFTGPLNADGSVNYVAALDERYRNGVKPEDNAAVLLIQAFGLADIQADRLEGTLKGLGLQPDGLPEKGEYLVSLDEFANTKPELGRTWEANADELDKCQLSWTAADHPLIAQWLTANGKPLDLIVKAAERKRYYWPMVGGADPPQLVNILIPSLSKNRAAARALRARAMLKFGAGDMDGATQDILAVVRLGRLMRQEPILITHLVGIGIEALADGAIYLMTGSEKMSGAQASKMLSGLQAVAQPTPMFEAMSLGERSMGLDGAMFVAMGGDIAGLEQIVEGRSSSAFSRPAMAVVLRSFLDASAMLRHMNKAYDQLEQAARKPTYTARAAASEETEDRLRAGTMEFTSPTWIAAGIFQTSYNRRVMFTHAVSRLIEGMMVPALGAAFRAESNGEVHANMAQVALALAAYKADLGAYPKQLAELTPRYLKAIPNDVFTDQPLSYKATEKGYLLYSVGPDLKNKDGNDPDSTYLTIRVPKP